VILLVSSVAVLIATALPVLMGLGPQITFPTS